MGVHQLHGFWLGSGPREHVERIPLDEISRKQIFSSQSDQQDLFRGPAPPGGELMVPVKLVDRKKKSSACLAGLQARGSL